MGLQTLFEADPKLWQTGSFASAAAHTGPLMPFAQGTVRQIKMDLVQLADSGNTHMIISADSISIDDLRLAYSQIMNNHISEQQSSSSNPTRSPKQAAQAIPASSPLVARVPAGVMARRKSDVGSRPTDTSASDLRQSISARDVPLSSQAAQDRERARVALSRPSMELHTAHSVPGPTATTSPEPARSKGNILPKAKRKAQGGSTLQAGELVSIISMEVVPELLDMLPDGAPVVHLVQCPYKPPADEGMHLTTPVPVPGRDIDRIEVNSATNTGWSPTPLILPEHMCRPTKLCCCGCIRSCLTVMLWNPHKAAFLWLLETIRSNFASCRFSCLSLMMVR